MKLNVGGVFISLYTRLRALSANENDKSFAFFSFDEIIYLLLSNVCHRFISNCLKMNWNDRKNVVRANSFVQNVPNRRLSNWDENNWTVNKRQQSKIFLSATSVERIRKVQFRQTTNAPGLIESNSRIWFWLLLLLRCWVPSANRPMIFISSSTMPFNVIEQLDEVQVSCSRRRDNDNLFISNVNSSHCRKSISVTHFFVLEIALLFLSQ